ncbi:MAG: hypothetical protein LBB47_06270 [Spirochaetaceae bacterium]|nr:hypothetical protein [Spirochaetaceae bacterium]
MGTLAMALAFMLVVAGCATNGGRYDTSAPVEQDAHIVVHRGGVSANTVNSFDGQQVNWYDKSFFGQLGGKFKVDIPAGEHTLTGMKIGLGASSAKPPTATHDFLAGHTYRVEIKGSELVITDITK